MSLEAGRETSVAYLLVTFDVPSDMEVAWFAEKLGHLESLYSYCEYVVITSRLMRGEPGPVPRLTALNVARMRYGSPWQLLLTSAGENAPYVALGGSVFYGTLYAMEKILAAKITLDNHRSNLRREDYNLEREKIDDAFNLIQQFNHDHFFVDDPIGVKNPPTITKAVHDVANLPPVTDAEVVSEDDPRV